MLLALRLKIFFLLDYWAISKDGLKLKSIKLQMLKHTTTGLLSFFFCLISFLSFANAPQIQLASIYRDNVDVSEFLVSEKLDGVRGYFDGEKLISRQGHLINAPQWFVEKFPKTSLDGELWINRGSFEKVSQIIRCKTCDDKAWLDVRFMIFDLPKSSEVFLKRYEAMQKLTADANSKYLQVINQLEIADHESLQKLLKSTVKKGGEGLMLHRKNSFYKSERNDDLLKLKTFEDDEAQVIAHIAGKGKNANKLGALLVENSQKIRFKIGNGFSDHQRKNPPKIGSTITYKFYGKTKNGVPRFASFWRERNEQ
jgi:DNA ligase 1